MKVRVALLSGVVLATGLVVAAEAAPAPKKVCNLIEDAKGDANTLPLAGSNAPAMAPNEPAYDIVNADVAADAKTVAAAIRVDKLSKTAQSSPTGIHWRVDFLVGEQQLFLGAATSSMGDKFSFGYVDATGSHGYTNAASGIFDSAKNEIRIWAPISAAAAQAKITPGTKLTGLEATAGRWYNTAGGNPSLSEFTDSAVSAKTYMAGSASCLTPGK